MSDEPERIVYGFCGFIGSGKNTAGRAIQDQHSWQHHTHSFAAPLKDAVSAVYGWDRDLLEGSTQESRVWREQPDMYWSSVFDWPYTPRTALQEIGTNVMRAYQPNIWIAACEKRTRRPGAHIFTDSRFGNELAWIRETGGLNVWVYRPQPTNISRATAATLSDYIYAAQPLSQSGLSSLMVKETVHASESAFLVEAANLIDVVVCNTYTPVELYQMVTHLDILRRARLLDELPLRERTLYLDMPTYDGYRRFRWRVQQPSTADVTSIIYTLDHRWCSTSSR